MIIKSAKQERTLREAGNISSDILRQLGNAIEVGLTPLDIEKKANELCDKYRVKAAFKTVPDYDWATCISVNDCILHGIPNNMPFKEGDIVKIDFGIIYKGYYTDHCWSWPVGNVSEEDKKLLKAGREATENGCKEAVVGNMTGDISHALRSTAEKYGYTTLEEFTGHGIGKTLWEKPEILAFGEPNTGYNLKDGMVICVECQVVSTNDIYISDNGWDVISSDCSKGTMFEYMGIVRDNNFVKLTDSF
jgi:methionyl aminopeptidase